MVDNVIILAGGSGTRLWPASIQSRPKQFLDPGVGKSLLHLTVERAVAIGTTGTIVIVTHHSQVRDILTECLKLGRLRERIVVLPEPDMRSTAPAIGFGLAYLADSGARDETTLVLSSDHLITPVEDFARDVQKADELARADYLVTFGIVPTRAETGYGYIEAGDALPPGRLVAAFREKPDAATAERYVAAGNYFWNSGMFVFKNSVLMAELGSFEPAIAAAFRAVEGLSFEQRRAALPTVNEEGISVAWRSSYIAQLYSGLPKISIDYAVLERSHRTAVVETAFGWHDIGSWDEMAQLTDEGVIGSGQDNSLAVGSVRDGVAGHNGGSAAGAGTTAGPATVGPAAPAYRIECEGTYVYSELPVVLCGVKDVAVVVKNGRVLVVQRGKSQLVKTAVEQMIAQGRGDLA